MVRTTELTTSDAPQTKKINKHETTSATWKTLASFLKQTASMTMIDQLEIPRDWPPPFTTINENSQLSDAKQATELRKITDPEEIEYYLLIRN